MLIPQASDFHTQPWYWQRPASTDKNCVFLKMMLFQTIGFRMKDNSFWMILGSLMIVRSMLVYQRPATAIDTRGMMGMAEPLIHLQ